MVNQEKIQSKNAIGMNSLKVYGIPLPLFAFFAVAVIAASLTDVLPGNIVGALGITLVLGVIFGEIGDRIPIWNEYVGGGAILAFLGSAYLVYAGIMPEKTIDTISGFIESTNFLNLFISVLITGSILSVNRKLLVRALAGYIPTIIFGVLGAMILGTIGGLITGISPREVITMYVLPIMGGGTGAGALPMSEIYASTTGNDPSNFLSFAFPILTIANIVAIIVAALLNKLGEKRTELTGNGELVRSKNIDAQDAKVDVKVTNHELGAGLLLSTGFFILATLVSKKILPSIFGVQIHTFAYMVLFVSLFNALNLIPEELKQGAKKLQSFFSGRFLWVIMIGVGVAYTDLGEIIAALTVQNVIVAAFIVVGATIGTALFGYVVGFFPIESAITAGLCMANRGGSGDLAVLGAAKRMDLISWAQISSRLGGGIMLVIASIVFGLFY
ncbi:citrate carrier protein, CCS family [Anaerovirgula multivorans]|uniref:Citrate carrier protein, CCS family n=1 Tax=Anaerovirgula multivorans TaxID=312168 RepID=A0A239FRV4_9FIRM|nr:2-hydroxycarboxylate transporter family protein [Anaerovirgula multivorans]SNS59328.1 citrate carrier protein, CCS family [Anaerovirgula multivorans]